MKRICTLAFLAVSCSTMGATASPYIFDGALEAELPSAEGPVRLARQGVELGDPRVHICKFASGLRATSAQLQRNARVARVVAQPAGREAIFDTAFATSSDGVVAQARASAQANQVRVSGASRSPSVQRVSAFGAAPFRGGAGGRFAALSAPRNGVPLAPFALAAPEVSDVLADVLAPSGISDAVTDVALAPFAGRALALRDLPFARRAVVPQAQEFGALVAAAKLGPVPLRDGLFAAAPAVRFAPTVADPSPVPLPAGLPMMLAGLALLGAVARGRKKAA